MKEHTSAEGLNVITAFMKDGDFYRMNPETKNFYPDQNELKEIYKDWEILEYNEAETRALAKRPDGSPMVNFTAKLIARKK